MSGPERYQQLESQEIIHFIENELRYEFKAPLSLDDLKLLLKRDRLKFLRELRTGLGVAVANSPDGWPYENVSKSYLDQVEQSLK